VLQTVDKEETTKTRVAAFTALAASVCFAWSFGFNYGVSNQVAYLLGGLRLVTPGILDNDWYATSTTHYHPAFVYLSALLLLIGGGWAIAIALTIVVTLGTIAIYWLTTLIFPKHIALPAFLLTLSICFVSRTQGVGMSYIFDPILQPSTLGSLFFLCAVPLFISGRWLPSGVFVALSGLFHANFLVLSLAVFSLSHVVLQGRHVRQRADLKAFAITLLRQLGPALLVVLLLSPLLAQSAGAPAEGPSPFDVLFKVRSPHHYLPSSFARDFMPFAAWQLIGFAAGFLVLREVPEIGRRLGALLVSMVLVIWSGTVLTTAIYEPRVAQLFVWRLAPFCDVLFQLLACAALVRAIIEPRFTTQCPVLCIVSVAAGVVSLLVYYGDSQPHSLRNLILALLGALVAAKVWHLLLPILSGRGLVSLLTRNERNGKVLAALGLSAVSLFLNGKDPVKAFGANSTLIRGFDRGEAELLRWMREATPRDATFLSPPDMESIRYHGQRAIVVDWKSTPIMPSDVVEWFRRIQDVTGRRDFRGAPDLDGYNSLDQPRLGALRAKYHLHYVIVKAGREAALRGERVFANARFVVLKLDAPDGSG
jgi:hypothetical protein